jgi:hypothetical protein
MPYLERPKPKPSDKRLLRQSIYQTARWRKLRDAHRMAHPICEKCGNKFMDDVHHKISPFKFMNPDEIKYWAYNPDNLIALCRHCHNLEHGIIR